MLDSFEVNKVLGAVLGTFLAVQAVHLMAGAVFAPRVPEKAGYEIAVTETPASGQEQPAKAPEEPLEQLLASASTERGQAAAKPCEVCHTFEKGGQNRVGPNLWSVVDRDRASEAGFNYSAAMKSKGGKWTFEELDKFLANPRRDIPGTAMTFAGIERGRQRADVVAYLRTLSDNPVPLPQVAQSPGESKSDDKSDAKGGANGDAKGDTKSDAKEGANEDTKGGSKSDAKGGVKGGTNGGAKGDAKSNGKGDTSGGAKGDAK
jgi:cytochrome c